MQFSAWPSIIVSSFIKVPSILLEICRGQNCDGHPDGWTDRRTDKAATICSPFGEHKNDVDLDSNSHKNCALLCKELGTFAALLTVKLIKGKNDKQLTTRTARKSDYTPALALPKHMSSMLDEKCTEKKKEVILSIPPYNKSLSIYITNFYPKIHIFFVILYT